jgi:hypothetical protein
MWWLQVAQLAVLRYFARVPKARFDELLVAAHHIINDEIRTGARNLWLSANAAAAWLPGERAVPAT